jgi:hypothetical protein
MYYLWVDGRWEFNLTLPEAWRLYRAWRGSVPPTWTGFRCAIYRDGETRPLVEFKQ